MCVPVIIYEEKGHHASIICLEQLLENDLLVNIGNSNMTLLHVKTETYTLYPLSTDLSF